MYILCQQSNKPETSHFFDVNEMNKIQHAFYPVTSGLFMGARIIQKLFINVFCHLLTCYPNPSLISPLLTNSLFLILSFCL